MKLSSLFLASVGVFASLGCSGLLAKEGIAAGECTDAADNDGDGLFDCDDPDCGGSAECAEGSAVGDDSADDADSDTDTDTDTDSPESGWTVSGVSVDFMTQAAAAKGLTVALADPEPAVSGGELDILGTTSTAADGTFSIGGIEGNPSLGAFLLVSGGGNMSTATAVASTLYSGFGDGDELADQDALVISGTMASGIDASLASLGVSKSINETGVLFIAVLDAAGNPVGGAEVSDGGWGQSIFYLDADSGDGLFTTGGRPNTATSAAAGGFAVIPGASIATYEADAAGKSGSLLAGAFAGLSVFTGITVE